MTLREAIRALQQSGYVESRRGRYGGTFVNYVLPKLNPPAELIGSSSLTAAVADVRMRINRFLDATPPLERNMAHSETQHRRIVTAILAEDVEAARRAMAEHLAATGALLRGFLS